MSFKSCKGFIGKWLIYETMPRYEPPRVKFRYGNESWQVISPADDYSITPIYDSGKYYYVTYAAYKSNGLCYAKNDKTVTQYTSRCKGDFRLEIEYDDYFNDGYYLAFYKLWKGNGYSYNGIAVGGFTFWIHNGCRPHDNQAPYNANSNTPPWLVSVVPIDHTINYRFTVYYNGQPVHQETRDIQPIAEVLPESCKYYFEDKKLVNIYHNNNPNNFMNLSTIGNTSIVWLLNDWSNLLPPRPEPFYILYKGTSNCDLPPKIDTECVPECLKCPDNTCAIPCGDVICCYNNDGVAVLSIPKERYCNE